MNYWLEDDEGNKIPLGKNYNITYSQQITCTDPIANMYFNDRELYDSLLKMAKRILRKERIARLVNKFARLFSK